MSNGNNYKEDLENAISVLANNDIILYPTDTIWGIGCNAQNKKAIKKIYALKNREEKKSMIILVENERMIYDYVKDPSSKLLSMMYRSERPTTAIFQGAYNLPSSLINEEDSSIAIRIVQDSFCRDLIKKMGAPIVSTSANISGKLSPGNFSEISDEIKNGTDYIVRYRQNDDSKSAPSSIITLDENGAVRIIR